ncbi:MAG: hypothetical protein WCJ35_03860 [Planctomycetota bacterium]
MNGAVLLAKVDLISIAIVIVFIIVPLIRVVVSKMREMVLPANPLPPGRNGGGQIQEQIDEFLRRAARRGGQPVAEKPQPVEVLAEEDAPVGGRVGQQVQKYMDTSDFRRRSEALGGVVAQSDQQFTQQVGQAFRGQVGRLASRPGEAAQPVEVVEAESSGPEYLSRPTLDALPIAGSGLAELLGSPENIVQAVIMAEILRRPEL